MELFMRFDKYRRQICFRIYPINCSFYQGAFVLRHELVNTAGSVNQLHLTGIEWMRCVEISTLNSGYQHRQLLKFP